MKLSLLGLGLKMTKIISQNEWLDIKEKIERFLADYGYNEEGLIHGHLEDVIELERKLKNPAEEIDLGLDNKSKIGMTLNTISVHFQFNNDGAKIPERIYIMPGNSGWDPNQPKHAMAVVERIESVLVEEGIFKIIYKCTWENDKF